jgi:hypothetical protein
LGLSQAYRTSTTKLPQMPILNGRRDLLLQAHCTVELCEISIKRAKR